MKSYGSDNRVALENDAPRLDIVEKVNGTARYTTDYYLPKMMWAAYIRSDFGDARLRKSNIAAARAVKGVLEVADRQGGWPLSRATGSASMCGVAGRRWNKRWLRSNWSSRRAGRGRGLKRSGRRSTTLTPAENDADAQKVLDESEVVAEAEFQTQVQTHTALEPHGASWIIAATRRWRTARRRAMSSFRNDLARELGLRPDQVEFHCEYVGGGFGASSAPIPKAAWRRG